MVESPAHVELLHTARGEDLNFYLNVIDTKFLDRGPVFDRHQHANDQQLSKGQPQQYAE